MSRNITVPIKVGLKGEYKAVVHKGDGVPIRETAWGKNIITGLGLDAALTYEDHGYCVAGNGNATPSISDTTLDSYLGKMSATISRTGSVNSDPGAGQLYISTLVRTQFNPGAFGGSPVNISEAGFTTGAGALSSVNSTTPLFSRGLLVDEFGNPTAVAVQPDEYLDIFWRFTVNLPYNTTGSFNLTVDGVPSVIDYQVRPLRLVPIFGPSNIPWNYVSGATLPNTQGNIYLVRGLAGFTLLGDSGVVGTPMVAPSGNITYPSTSQPTAASYSSYNSGDYYRDITLVWALAQGNVIGGIQTVIVYTGYTCWQLQLDPVINKDDTRQLNLTFRISVENTP
jgi:hypothetical protein